MLKNKKGDGFGSIVLLIIIVGLVYFLFFMNKPAPLPNYNYTNPNITNMTNITIIPPEVPKFNAIDTGGFTFKVAAWNLQIYGDAKASQDDITNYYADKIRNYDVFFIEEIRDESGDAFLKLCERLPDYTCVNSSRAGRSTSKEQYGLFYRKLYTLVDYKDYNTGSYTSQFERPPMSATIDFGRYNLTFYINHFDPNNVVAEMGNMENIANADKGNVVILGDLNADCSYFKNTGALLKDYTWAIYDTQDTTVSSTDCAYDRIILNNNTYDMFATAGIDSSITAKYSDHYIVYAAFAR